MINYNGQLTETLHLPLHQNRGFLFGDSVFETMKILNGKVLFLEDHYFRLMASMRIVRMEIPMNFTLEYFEEQILNLVKSCKMEQSARVRFSVFRQEGGFYLPQTNNIDFVVVASELKESIYSVEFATYEVELFKDFHVSAQLISTLKSNNKLIQIAGNIFANENGYANCLVMNEQKNVVEALQNNLFLLSGNKLITPPLSDGCLNGVMRKQIIAIVKKMDDLEFSEESVSPFDLQKADELFLTNVVKGIQPVTKYRKKEFKTDFSMEILKRLNAQILLT